MKPWLILVLLVVAALYLKGLSDAKSAAKRVAVDPTADPDGGDQQVTPSDVYRDILGLINGAIGANKPVAATGVQRN